MSLRLVFSVPNLLVSAMSGGGVWGLIFRFPGVLSKNVGVP